MIQFVLAEAYRYWWPVLVAIPDPAKAGVFQEQQLHAEFVPLSADEAQAHDSKYRELTTADERAVHERSLLLTVTKNWRDVVGADGEELPFSEEAMRQAMQWPWFRNALYRAYAESLSGDKPRLGN